MNRLYTDDNKDYTITGLCFKTKICAEKSILKIEKEIDAIKNKQKENDFSPYFLHPRKFLSSKNEIERYYSIQKMYRVLALLNRANVLFTKQKEQKKQKEQNNKNIDNTSELYQSIIILKNWINNYKEKNKIKQNKNKTNNKN